jgi:outer membrane protein assembly factor BamB
MKLSCPNIALLISLFFVVSAVHAEEDWPQFRGPGGNGHSADTDVAPNWGPEDVAWKTELPGSGQSSPIIWGSRIFLTSASEDGATRYVLGIDRSSGEILWETEVSCASPGGHHKMNTFATPTCATDGERVVAFFGEGGIHCLDVDGKKLWSRDLGDFPVSWGIAASPVILGNIVVQNCDAEGPSSLIALDLASGETVWETKRENKPKGGWSTPVLIEGPAGEELILNGEFGVRGYDPKSGEELWFCEGFNGRGSPMPAFAHDLLYVVNGKPGDLYTVKPGGKGNVTESHMEWHAERRGGRDLPAPAVVGDFVVVVCMPGIASCYDAHTGELYYHERLPVEGEFAASPLVANGLVYFTNVFGGETVVIKPGKTLDVVAQNSVGADRDEIFRSTLSPVDGKLYLRSQSTLYCIGE